MRGSLVDQCYVCFAATAKLVAEPGDEFKTAGAAANHDDAMRAG